MLVHGGRWTDGLTSVWSSPDRLAFSVSRAENLPMSHAVGLSLSCCSTPWHMPTLLHTHASLAQSVFDQGLL